MDGDPRRPTPVARDSTTIQKYSIACPRKKLPVYAFQESAGCRCPEKCFRTVEYSAFTGAPAGRPSNRVANSAERIG
jgi:hypothetical protein